MWRLVGVVALLMGVCSAEPSMWVEGAKPDEAVTPYFAHYAFPLLIENINLDLALDQYRTCWGWALGGGRTTWVEVFDTRWTHCHQWAECPSPITLSVNTWDGGENLQIKGTNLLTFSHDSNAGWILTDRSNSSEQSTPQPDSADVQSGATKTQPVERP